MAKVLVMRYNKGKLPPSALTDEFKKIVGGAMEKYLSENPQVKVQWALGECSGHRNLRLGGT